MGRSKRWQRTISSELPKRTFEHARNSGATNKALITFPFSNVSQGTRLPINPKSIVAPIDDAAACRCARQAASLTYILAQSPAPSNAAAAR
jgi:hypothetical protein